MNITNVENIVASVIYTHILIMLKNTEIITYFIEETFKLTIQIPAKHSLALSKKVKLA